MSSFDADGWNRPPSTYDPSNRRGRLHASEYPGLWWRATKTGIVWELKFRQDGELRSNPIEGATTEREAINAWRRLKPDHDKGETVLARGDRRVSDVAEAFFAKLDLRIAQGKKKAKTKKSYKGAYDKHIAPTLGALRVKDLDVEVIVTLFADLTDAGLSQWTQCGVKNVLGQMLKLAKREKWIVVNPLEDVDPDDLPTQQARAGYKPRLFRNEELAKMIEACHPLYSPMLIVMAFTGLRIGELCGLTWADIDLDARTLTVARQLDFADGEWTTAGPKGRASAATNLSYRTIKLLQPAYDALAAQETAEIVKGFRRPEDFVFTTSDWRGASGKPVLPDNFRSRGVQAAATDAGLGHVRPHDFRHTTASILAACRVPDTDAAAMMGHTVEVYRRVYAASFADARARETTADALGEWYADMLGEAA